MTYLGMDNFAVRVVGAWDRHGDDHLVQVLALVLRDRLKCVGWREVDGVLFLLWSIDRGATVVGHPFPAPIDNAVEMHALVVRWLAVNPPAEEIDHGSDTKEIATGFEAWTDEWGHGGGDRYALLAIKPRTRWIGK